MANGQVSMLLVVVTTFAERFSCAISYKKTTKVVTTGDLFKETRVKFRRSIGSRDYLRVRQLEPYVVTTSNCYK